MSTVTATLEVQADGTVHLPVPKSLHAARLHVTATLEPAESSGSSKLRGEAFRQLRALDLFREITDPVAWQKEQRADRNLI